MKNIWCTFFLMILALSAPAQSYDQLWSQVQEASRQDLPRKALGFVETIRHKAICEKQDIQLLKAHLALIQYNHEINTDSLVPYTRLMVQAMEREKRPFQLSLWHSALAQVYEQNMWPFAMQNVPVKETRAKVVAQYEASLAEPGVLLVMNAKDCIPLFKEQPDSRYFNNDCLHVLYQAYVKSPVPQKEAKLKCIARLRELYKQYANNDAVILLTLDELDIAGNRQDVTGRLEDHAYYQKLKQLYEKYPQQPASLYVLLRMAALFQSSYADSYSSAYSLEIHNHNDSILYDWIDKGLNNPLYRNDKKGQEALQSLLRKFAAPEIVISQFKENYMPSEAANLSVLNRNVENLTFRVIPLFSDCADYDAAPEKIIRRTLRRHRDIAKVYRYNLTKRSHHWSSFGVNMEMPQQPGVYALYVEANHQKICSRIFRVTSLMPLVFSPGNGEHHLLAIDRENGKPVNGTRVQCYDSHGGKLLKTYRTTDAALLIRQKDENQSAHCFYVRSKTDLASEPWRMYCGLGFRSVGEEKEQVTADLFTDRAIYRPGQLLSWAGVVYTRTGDRYRPESAVNGWVTCTDYRGKVLDSVRVQTDAYGVFQGSFQLPAEVMNGLLSLTFKSDKGCQGYENFRVEEYKRPTLYLSFMPHQERYTLNDSVWVEGVARTYTGLPVSDARVTYRTSYYSWWNEGRESEPQNGEVCTDKEGRFRFRIKLALNQVSQSDSPYNCHFFRVHCAVTARQGETVEDETLFSVENRRAYIRSHIPEVVCKEYLPDCRVELLNAAGQQAGDTVYCELWQADSLLRTDTLCSHQHVVLRDWQQLPSGTYRMVLRADDEVARLTQPLQLFSQHDAHIPTTDSPWFTYARQNTAADSTVAFVGTSFPDAMLYYYVVASDSIVDSRRISVNGTLQRFDLNYRPEYGEGATAYWAMVRQGKLYTYSCSVQRPVPDKRLKLNWTSFRSELQLGQQEEWRLRITRPDGTPVRANVMACLYDASLDQLASLQWLFSSVSIRRTLPGAQWSASGADAGRQRFSGSLSKEHWFAYPRPELTGWDPALFDYSYGVRSHYYRQAMYSLCKSSNAEAKGAPDQVNAVAEDRDAVQEEVAEVVDGTAEHEENGSSVKPRSNFAETAFFRPVLRTDAHGEVSWTFTLPESMTQWNFRALAHDGQMNHGSLTALVTARKKFMVQPAMPRFVRQGDRVSLPVTVTNLSDSTVKVMLTMTLADGIHESEILKTFKVQQVLPPRTDQLIYFEFSVLFDVPGLVCRVMATGDGFSDGEEHWLPVVSGMVEVSRSFPFSMHQSGTLDIDLPTGLQGRKVVHPVLDVELTSDPLWYTLSSLPAWGDIKSPLVSTDWTAMFSAVTLSRSLVSRHPEIVRMVQEQRSEVKELLSPRLRSLDHTTPWLTQAENESQRMSQLAEWLDAEQLQTRSRQALSGLQALQQPDGGWSWCPGMRSNLWNTMDIAVQLARMQQLTGNQEARPLLDKAYAYLQKKMSESVERMKQQEQKYGHELKVSEFQLRYLYLTQLLDKPLRADGKFLLQRSLTLRKELTLYGKALAACIWADTGHRSEAELALQSLLEHTTVTPEMGRFFETSRAWSSASSYRIPTQCATIETLRRFGRSAEEQEMLLWLLQSKRTQLWNSWPASVEAVYTILGGTGEQSALQTFGQRQPLHYVLYHGQKRLAVSSADSVKTPHTTVFQHDTYTDKEYLKADRIEITKQDEGLSWGAVRAISMKPEDEVVKSGSGFDLTYTLEVWTDGQWTKYRLGKPLYKGMRMRRLYTVKAERDYDFVRLRADRPACFVPVQPFSGTVSFDRLMAYQLLHDQSTDFYIEHLAKGTYQLAEEFFVDRSGVYATGVSRIDCLQAPEYTAVTPSVWLHVE